MNQGLVMVAYIGASILFILSLDGLSHQEKARKGNGYGIAGMVIAIAATIYAVQDNGLIVLLPAMLVGALIGIILALRVEMTQMPQLVAILHSFVGLAAVLVGIASYLGSGGLDSGGLDSNNLEQGVAKTIHEVEIYLGVFIGAITFSGSIIAFAKLAAIMGGKPLLLPGRHVLNLLGIVGSIYLGSEFLSADSVDQGVLLLLVMAVIATVIGAHLVMAIGGADMPVVVSMLNSYSGWAAAATGFMLANDLLIVVGALVGSSGAILSYIMCKAMNRNFISVILGGFGTTNGSIVPTVPGAVSGEPAGEVQSVDVDRVAVMLNQAKAVVIVPGYGMAVAQAQNTVSEITKILRARGCKVRFAIHPVAGRMPGHMNVLLAEAKVPYDIVLEMDEINDDFPQIDVVLVVGANDIVNPSALDDPSSPIAGMPVLQIWNAKSSVVLKRSMASGYAGVDNPLFYRDNTLMLFGDAKDSLLGVLSRLK